MADRFPIFEPRRLTKAGKALASAIRNTRYPIISNFQIFQILRQIYRSGEKLYLRSELPFAEDLKRIRYDLRKAGVLDHDHDFGNSIWRVRENTDRAADEIVCLAEPFTYVSHLSAMARYGLTDRRPRILFLTTPNAKTGQELVKEMMREEYGPNFDPKSPNIVRPTRPRFPTSVRGQEISVHMTSKMGFSKKLRGSFTRLSSIGQTFIDTVDDPSLCGGMNHVLDVWSDHAHNYIGDIIEAGETARTTIAQSRAGYILNERLGVQDDRLERWATQATRGSSRLLDPEKPFSSTFSEKWKLSLNV